MAVFAHANMGTHVSHGGAAPGDEGTRSAPKSLSPVKSPTDGQTSGSSNRQVEEVTAMGAGSRTFSSDVRLDGEAPQVFTPGVAPPRPVVPVLRQGRKSVEANVGDIL